MVCILDVEFENPQVLLHDPPADRSGAVSSRRIVDSFNLKGCGDKVDITLTKSHLK